MEGAGTPNPLSVEVRADGLARGGSMCVCESESESEREIKLILPFLGRCNTRYAVSALWPLKDFVILSVSLLCQQLIT